MTQSERQPRTLEILAEANWAMTYGDRVALEGALSMISPRLAIEIGTAQGGSLKRIAAHSAEVHAIDVVEDEQLELPGNVSFHLGESSVVLPELLERFASAGKNVDFALVDGDHSPGAVRADIETLLASPAVTRTAILVHDSFSPWVREGVARAGAVDHPKVVLCQLDFVPGGVWTDGPFENQMWGGLALVLVDDRPPDRPLDRIQLWLDGPRSAPAGFDAWETVIRAEPVVAAMRKGGDATALDRLRLRLRRLLRGRIPEVGSAPRD